MKGSEHYNPFVYAFYFLAVTGIAMFVMNPVCILLALAGAFAFFFVRKGRKNPKAELFYLGLFAVLSLINPLFVHRGSHILFFLNDNPITLEATIYGLCSSAALLAVLYWCRSFSSIMTGDKLMYIFGALTPKLSLVLSMALRYIPLFGQKARQIRSAQKGIGLYKDENVIDSIRSDSKVFSILLTWGLEKGIITADSMSARGYGSGRRSSFAIYRFRRSDLLLLIWMVILFGAAVAGSATAETAFVFYPELVLNRPGIIGMTAYIAYGLLAFMPTILRIAEEIRWKYLLSKL